MHYIVLDLEWNQPLSYQSQVYREVGDRLIFEMIQIGAVKMDAERRVVDSISIPIHPTHYVKIHPRIRRMTHLGAEELADAPFFLEAMERFTAWCGEDYALLTWGCDDVSVLKQNMDFFQCGEKLPPLCDIQRMYSDATGCKDRKGLKAAMDEMRIVPDENRAFHNALDDAYYTALVFAKMLHPERALNYPQAPKKLLHISRARREKLPGEVYGSLRDALTGDTAQHPRCPRCGKPAPLEAEGYIKQCAGKYIGLGQCADHGAVLIRLYVQPTDDGKRLMHMSTAFATAANRAYIHTKKLQVAEREACYLKEHGTLPDPEEELLRAERSRMPFED